MADWIGRKYVFFLIRMKKYVNFLASYKKLEYNVDR